MGDSTITKTFAHKSTETTKPCVAAGKVSGAGALTDGVNVASVVRAGVGDYDVVLTAPGIPITDRHISLTLREGGQIFLATSAGATTFSVNCEDDGGAPADLDWEFAVFRTQPA
ncbi:MAG: hypothetical protein JSV86_17040 [Gemmatimonadota bacterium]|nr:MAG: hypothetical protein JSV86_17040 [Gemmatimonadota bacterium]